MLFEWDPFKNSANFRKHGLSFEDVLELFTSTAGRFLVWRDDRKDYGEERWLGMGEITEEDARLAVVVVFTRRDESVRIISARPAHAKERNRYYEGQ